MTPRWSIKTIVVSALLCLITGMRYAAAQDTAATGSISGVVMLSFAIGSDYFRNDIIVRGGSPREHLFVVDTVEVPNINSFVTFVSARGTVGILDRGIFPDVGLEWRF